MSKPQYTLVNTGEQKYVTVYVEGREPLSADDSHPYFKEILDCLYHDDCGSAVLDLFDLAETASKKFQQLSERVSVKDGQVFFDGDRQDDTITDQIVRFIDEGRDDWLPLVRFMENVAANLTDHSREQLYDWLRVNNLTITDDGLIIGYKGVARSDRDGYSYESLSSGTATVDGKTYKGSRIPQDIGSVVEMPRSSVQHDPGAACSTGLHVGTKGYAQAYANGGALLEVHVNPRDVVSVPTDADGNKVRVCRYLVRREVSEPIADDLSDDRYY